MSKAKTNKDNLLSIAAGSAGQVLTSNGAGLAPTFQSAGSMSLVVVTLATVTAVAGSHYVLTNAGLTTVTLPIAPVAGDILWVTVGNGRTDNVLNRNGNNIMSLAENLTIDNANTTLQLRYINSTLGWRFL